MTTPQDWTRRELDSIFNRHAEHIETIAREMSPVLQDVSVAIDITSREPVIRFVFADNTAPDLDRLPRQIGGTKVTHTFRT